MSVVANLQSAAPEANLAEIDRSGCALGATLHWFAATASTNRVAAEIGAAGASHGTVVVAEHQTAGSGKGDRVWASKPGAGLLFSVLLRPEARFEDLPQITLLAAVAMVDALAANGVSDARVKWPNDILIDGLKVCGILAETGTAADGSVFVVLGVGLNVNETLSDFPPELREIATSLAATTGRPMSRQRLFHAFLDALDVWLARWRAGGFDPIREAWCARSCTLGRRVRFTVGEVALTGEAVGLEADGSLAIRDQTGALHCFHSGEMRFVAEPPFEPSHKRSVS